MPGFLLAFFMLFFCRANVVSAQNRVLFTREIAPILTAHCVSCHHDGGSAPFPLMTYADARKRAQQIALVTQNRTMPPWRAAPDVQNYLDAHTLTPAQITTIREWAERGALEGEVKYLPTAPRFETDKWQLGRPDVILTLPKPYTLGGDVQHIYRSFVIPLPFVEDRWIRGIEFRPTNPPVVRQATLYLDTMGTARKREAQSGAVGYADFNSGVGSIENNSVYDWTVGVTPRFLPEGAGIPVKRGSDLVVQMRFRPSGKPETIGVQIGLYFHKTPPVVTPLTVKLGASEYYLQSGKQSVVSDSFTLPVPVRVTSLIANLHPVGTQAKVTAKAPDGSERVLLFIPEWDSEWRRPYTFARPLALAAGTTLTMEYRFDNSDRNPRNPRPETIRPNLKHLEDMASLWVTVLPAKLEDRKKIEDANNRPARRPNVVETGTYLRQPKRP